MPIDAGDVVLSAIVDLSQVDAGLASLGTKAAGLGPVTAAVGGLDAAAAKAGVSAQAAATEAGELDARFLAMGQTLSGVKQPLDDTGEGLKQTAHQSREARGEAALLNDVFRQNFGISLPRHVRSFLAELPGVSTALSAAFSATAVLFLIDALVKGIEKIQEWAEHGDKIAAAWEKYDETIFQSSTHMQGEIDKQKQKLIEMTEGPVAALDFALKHIQTTAFETFNLITKDVAAAVAAMNESSSGLLGIQFNVFKDAGKDLDKFKDSVQKAMREAGQASPGDPFAPYNAGITAVQAKERELTALITQRTAASGRDASAAVDGLHAERQAVNDMLPLLQKGVELQRLKNTEAKQSETGAAATERIAEAKRVETEQLAAIELVKSRSHLAFANGILDADGWSKAQIKAANDSRVAHEAYLAKVTTIYKQSGEVVKAHAAGEELSTGKIKDATKAIEDLAKESEKLSAEQKKWDKLSQETFLQRIKETKELEQEEIRLAAIDPLPKIAKDALHLNDTLKAVGVQGMMSLRQHLQATEKAENALNDAGVHGGKIWLQVQAAKLKAIIAVEQAEGKATIQEIKDLRKLENELKGYDGVVKSSKSQVAAAWIGEAVAAGVAADGIGAAAQKILQSVLQSLSGMAFAKGTEQLALAFAAMSPLSGDTAGPGPHFASAAEWFALGSVASVAGGFAGGGSGGGSSSGSNSATSTQSAQNTPATQPEQHAVQTTNVQHFGGGGLVTQPTFAVVGEVPEVIVPLERNSHALDLLADRVAARLSGGGGGNVYIENNFKGSLVSHAQLMKELTRQVNQGTGRMTASNSNRLTRKS